jgi:hypothetical protein
MQKVVLFICATLALICCGVALWNREAPLAAAWASAFCGWVSSLIAHFRMD